MAGKSSPANTAAARKNGAKGGRPKSKFPAAVLKRIGPPPINKPLKLARWWTEVLSEMTWLQINGKPGLDSLAKEIRSAAAAAGRVLPHDIQFEAARLIQLDTDEMDADAGPVEEVISENEPRNTRSVRCDSAGG